MKIASSKIEVVAARSRTRAEQGSSHETRNVHLLFSRLAKDCARLHMTGLPHAPHAAWHGNRDSYRLALVAF